MSIMENYCPASLLLVVRKVFEKLGNYLQHNFKYFQSTANLLTDVSEIIARAFDRSGATRAVALDIFKAFKYYNYRQIDCVLLHFCLVINWWPPISCSSDFGILVFFTNLHLMEFLVSYLTLFCLLSDRWLEVVLDGKSSQEYPVNVGVPEGSILSSTLFLLYINDHADNVICNIGI